MDAELREAFREAIREETGLALDDDHDYLLDRTAEAFVERGRAPDAETFVEEYVARRDAELSAPLMASLVSNETYFFRDTHPFEGLRKEILPELFEERGVAPVRLWSAACSTGQEPYSIAFLLSENFPEAWPDRVRLVGSDVSPKLLEQARAGRYTQLEVNRGLPARYLPKYFTQDTDGWKIDREIRDHVEFTRVDVTEPLDWSQTFDVVVLRYLLTYYTDSARRRILDRIHGVMAERSYLILGGTETWGNIHDGFELLRTGASRYYRRLDP